MDQKIDILVKIKSLTKEEGEAAKKRLAETAEAAKAAEPVESEVKDEA